MGFLEAVLTKMDFDHNMVYLFMSCISSVSYQISHAGTNFGSIILARGLRQGDPLFSYLFFICIEGFTALLQDYERRKMIKDIKVARSAPSISHMFFKDYSYIFCKTSMESVDLILQMLKNFEKASGQQIKVDKSSVFFSKNATNSLKRELCQKLIFQGANDHSLLGLPNTIGRNKSLIFGFLKEKIQDQM